MELSGSPENHASTGQPSHNHGTPEADSDHAAKHLQILAACASQDRSKLAKLATSEYGLLTDDHRRSAWPVLLGCTHHAAHTQKISDWTDWTTLPRHRDEDQVKLDVDRAFVYYPSRQFGCTRVSALARLTRFVR